MENEILPYGICVFPTNGMESGGGNERVDRAGKGIERSDFEDKENAPLQLTVRNLELGQYQEYGFKGHGFVGMVLCISTR